MEAVMDAAKTEAPKLTYQVISTGSLVNKISKPVVINKICKQFSVREETAEKLLRPKVIIKKGLSQEAADKYKKLFNSIGLLVVAVRESSSADNDSSKKETAIPRSKQDFESLLDSSLPVVPVSSKYKLGLFLVILISTIAPVIYLGIIFGLLAGIAAYSSALPSILVATSGAVLKAIIVVVPLFILLVLLLFLIKPLFAKHVAPRQYKLKRKQFPALFNLVEVMCRRIGVPVPVRISVNNEVNASAGSAKGLFSLIKGELELTVGLPLITGMSIRQFAGILAHEFGHFAQPSAMTAYYLVNTINFWFASRAHHPDEWDERLESWAEKADWHIAISVAIMGAQLGIYLTRKLFGFLYLLNLKTTQFMSRHMEYDADAYESIFSGSDQFKSTAIQLRKLSYAEQNVIDINKSAWNENKLLADFSAAVAVVSDGFDKSVEDYIAEDMKDSGTNAWDSHPADNDRIEHARMRKDAGLLTAEFPAASLCDDISSLSKIVTIFTYHGYGIKKPEQYIRDNAAILQTDEEKNRARDALDRFFNSNFHGRFLLLQPLDGKDDIPNTVDKTIDQLRAMMGGYAKQNEEYQQLIDNYSVMAMGEAYLSDNVELELQAFHLASDDSEQIRVALQKVRESIFRLDQQLENTDRLFFHRFQYDARFMDENQLKKLRGNLQILEQMKALSVRVFTLQHHKSVLEALLGNEEELIVQIEASVNRYGQYCVEETINLLDMCRHCVYGKDGLATLDAFVKSWSEDALVKHDPVNPGLSLDFANMVLSAISYHYYWTLAELCELAILVETKNNIAQIKLV